MDEVTPVAGVVTELPLGREDEPPVLLGAGVEGEGVEPPGVEGLVLGVVGPEPPPVTDVVVGVLLGVVDGGVAKLFVVVVAGGGDVFPIGGITFCNSEPPIIWLTCGGITGGGVGVVGGVNHRLSPTWSSECC